jgi:hypothetical protein
MQFQRNISLLLGRMDPRRYVEFYPGRCSRLHAGEFHPGHDEVGRRGRDVRGRAPPGLLWATHVWAPHPATTSWAGGGGGLPGRRPGVHPQWWRHQRSPSPWAGSATRTVELVHMRTTTALVRTQALAELVRMRTEGRAVRWSQHEWGR